MTLSISAPELKAHVHYYDHALSVCPSSLTFHIFDFSSETAEWNSTKLDRKQDLNVLCLFGLFHTLTMEICMVGCKIHGS